jgi:ATP-dependent Zn protease
MATLVNREIKTILDEGYAMARRVLHEHFDQLQCLADALMEHEQLDRAAFEALVKA